MTLAMIPLRPRPQSKHRPAKFLATQHPRTIRPRVSRQPRLPRQPPRRLRQLLFGTSRFHQRPRSTRRHYRPKAPTVETLPTETEPQPPSAVVDETPPEPATQPSFDPPQDALPELPAPSKPFIAPPPLNVEESLVPDAPVSPSEPNASPAQEPVPASPPSNLFNPPAESPSPAQKVAPTFSAPAISPQTSAAPIAPPTGADKNVDPHLDLFARNAYPSAREMRNLPRGHLSRVERFGPRLCGRVAHVPQVRAEAQRPCRRARLATSACGAMRRWRPVSCASRAEPLWNLPEVAREGSHLRRLPPCAVRLRKVER